jgi:hypothetical protein
VLARVEAVDVGSPWASARGHQGEVVPYARG